MILSLRRGDGRIFEILRGITRPPQIVLIEISRVSMFAVYVAGHCLLIPHMHKVISGVEDPHKYIHSFPKITTDSLSLSLDSSGSGGRHFG